MPPQIWNRALVTGASAGIGVDFARQLAIAGTDLVLVARTVDALESLATELRDATGVQVEVLPADLTKDAELDKVCARLGDSSSPVDLLVNNAGYGRQGRFHELDADDQDRMIRLNVSAVVALTHAAIPAMRERGRGGILNVASMVALTPMPHMAVYGATKAFVLSFSEAIHEELKPRGIHVTCLAPGFTSTNFAAEAKVDASQVPSFLWMESGPVAKAGLDAVRANRAVVTPGANAIGAAVARLTPTVVLRKGVALAMGRGGN